MKNKYLYTIMVRKAFTSKHLFSETKELITKFHTQPEKMKIYKTIELSHSDFELFKNNLLNDWDFIKELDQNEFPIFLVKEVGASDSSGIIVDPSGSAYARYSGLVIEEQEMFQCSNCGGKFIGHPAISRKDNKSPVCSQCGLVEAVNDFALASFLEDLQISSNTYDVKIIVEKPNGETFFISPQNEPVES